MSFSTLSTFTSSYAFLSHPSVWKFDCSQILREINFAQLFRSSNPSTWRLFQNGLVASLMTLLKTWASLLQCWRKWAMIPMPILLITELRIRKWWKIRKKSKNMKTFGTNKVWIGIQCCQKFFFKSNVYRFLIGFFLGEIVKQLSKKDIGPTGK